MLQELREVERKVAVAAGPTDASRALEAATLEVYLRSRERPQIDDESDDDVAVAATATSFVLGGKQRTKLKLDYSTLGSMTTADDDEFD